MRSYMRRARTELWYSPILSTLLKILIPKWRPNNLAIVTVQTTLPLLQLLFAKCCKNSSKLSFSVLHKMVWIEAISQKVLRLNICITRYPKQQKRSEKKKLNKIVFAMSNRKTKTSELLLIKYIKITKLFVIESHRQVCDSIAKSFLILKYFISNNSLVLVFLCSKKEFIF